MANKVKPTNAFDELFAAYQAGQPQVTSGQVPSISTDTGALTTQEQGIQHSYMSDAAAREAQDAATQMKITLARYKAGAISKKDAEQVFSDYQTKVEVLKSYDIIAAQNIQNDVIGRPQETTQPQSQSGVTSPGPAAGTPVGMSGPIGDQNAGPKGFAQPPAGLQGPTGTTGPVPTKKTTGPIGGTGSGTGNKPTKPEKPISQAEAFANFKSQYPDEAAIINADPSLKELFNKAMNATGGAWSVQKFQEAYESSAYYQTHSDAFRNAEQARLGHGKGSYADAYNNAIDNIRQYAIEAGITIDPKNLGIDPKSADQTGHIVGDPNNPHPYDPQGNNLVDDILHKYWDTGAANKAAIVRYLASKGTVNTDLVGGEAQQNVEQLKNWANDLGLNNLVLTKGANYFTDAAMGIAQGKSDINFWHQDLINQAAQLYPIFAKQINAGASVRGIAAPYINTLSNLLEIPPEKIDLADTTGDGAMVRRALQGDNTTPTSVTDFATQVRQDPRWAKTLNAQDAVESTAHKILTDFGVAT